MHSSSNRESLHLVAARAPGGDLFGSTLQLRIRLTNIDWVNYNGLDWASVFCYEVVNQARRIQLIHRFHPFPQPAGDVSTWSTEVVTREVTLPLVVWRDVSRHADQSGSIG